MKYFVFCLFMVFIAYSQGQDSYEGCADTADAAVCCLVGADAMDEFGKDFGKCTFTEIDWMTGESACLNEIYNKYMNNPDVRNYLGQAWCKAWMIDPADCSDEVAEYFVDTVMFWVGVYNVLVNEREGCDDRCGSKEYYVHWLCHTTDDRCKDFYVGNECNKSTGKKRSLIPNLGLSTMKKSIIPDGFKPELSSVSRSLRNLRRGFKPNFKNENKLSDLLRKLQK